MTVKRLGVLILLTSAIATPALSADVVTEWNQKTAATQEKAEHPRLFALSMVHVAMYDAINSIQGLYTPYKFKVAAAPSSSPEAAGVAAAHAVLVKLFPDEKANLDSAYADSLERVADGPAKTQGIAVGEEVAAKVLAWRASDNADAPNTYRPFTAPGAYVPTTLPWCSGWASAPPMPWLMQRASQFRPGPPPTLSSAEWAADYDEVKELGAKNSSKRTSEQTAMARFWADTNTESWDTIVRQLAASPGRSLSQNARLFALVEMAEADATLASCDAKYAFSFWRPITAIRNGDIDGNDATDRDASWEPLLETPLFPEYPCAHCIASATARAILEAEFGTGAILLQMAKPKAPSVVRKWNSIAEYAEEVSSSRIYGGVHYRNSTVVGKAMGQKIGELAVQNFLKSIH